MKTLGLDIPDNCTLIFHANGIKVRISLNIPKELRNFIPIDKTHKATEFYIYWVQFDLESKYCNDKNIRSIYNKLLNAAMRDVRVAKQKFLQHQINKLQQTQTQLEF